MTTNERLTRIQAGALREIQCRPNGLVVGWGGISLRTMRSLEDRGLARSGSDERRFHLTQKGYDWIAAHDVDPDSLPNADDSGHVDRLRGDRA